MMTLLSLKLIGALFMLWLVLQVERVCGDHVEVKCKEKERQALLQFKAGLVDDFGILSSWEGVDCCKWKGVGCNNQTGHIIMVDLHGRVDDDGYAFEEQFLWGMIHKSLMELQHLMYLNLSRNDFVHNPIPYFFGTLSNLRYLDLSFCYFHGNIPSQLGNLSHLEYLDLRWNDLKGPIPYQLGNLSKLQHLDLSWNDLEGTIPSQLGKLSSLQKLYFGFNYFGALKIDHGNHAGGQWLSNLTSLTHLDLSYVFNLNKSHNWLQMIGELPNLKELQLSECGFSDHFIFSLGPSKFNFFASLSVFDLSSNAFKSSIIFQWVSNVSSNLVELDLSNNNLVEGPLSNDFGTAMTSLEQLDLHSNRLKDSMMKSLMNICTLQSLDMGDNNMIEDFPLILHHLSTGCVRYSLQHLYLYFNQITGTLPDLSMFPSLKTLDLSNNRLIGSIPEGSKLPSHLQALSIDSNSLRGGIPKSFGNTCNLSLLDLHNNSLSDELAVIFHHLSGCARYSLQHLYLDSNQLTGKLPYLSIFPSVKELHLSENRLSGMIPPDIQFPSQLKDFKMNSNSLKGVISDFNFVNMSKLRVLDLSDNSLTLSFIHHWIPPFQLDTIGLRSCNLGPSFPNWLKTQNSFTRLDISNARISSIVPEWFWAQLTKVLSMNISYNDLTGTIPNLPVRLVNYPSMILTANQFEGPIPLFLRNATSLDLSKNKFSDSLLFLCANDTVKTLGLLDLSNNKLSEQIPNCWSHFKSLAYLDLSNNHLSGQIPTSMGSVLELQVLILRNNSLTGELPISMRSCKNLVMLDLEENNLSGLIPSWIGSNLQKLKMLSLRRNQFLGSLPLSLCNLTSIHLLDLSSNILCGPIPKCFKDFNAMTQERSTDSNDHYYLINHMFGQQNGDDYELNALLMWKGVEHTINNDKLLLRSIDLSSNHLSYSIPTEIESLVGLVSLNLSRNNLTGIIPSKIGKLTSLEFLDLSRNQLFGSIPSSLAQIDRLTMLDLSYNNLSGEIPVGTQLQGFTASCYEHNLDLCGRPLEKMCKGSPPQDPIVQNQDEDEHLLINRSFYLSMAFGFIVGFWGTFGSILVNRSWRHAYFKYLKNLMDNIYVTVAVKVAKYQRWLKG